MPVPRMLPRRRPPGYWRVLLGLLLALSAAATGVSVWVYGRLRQAVLHWEEADQARGRHDYEQALDHYRQARDLAWGMGVFGNDYYAVVADAHYERASFLASARLDAATDREADRLTRLAALAFEEAGGWRRRVKAQSFRSAQFDAVAAYREAAGLWLSLCSRHAAASDADLSREAVASLARNAEKWMLEIEGDPHYASQARAARDMMQAARRFEDELAH